MKLYLVNAGAIQELVDPSDYGTMEFALVIAGTRGKARALYLSWTSEWLEWTSKLQILKVCELDKMAHMPGIIEVGDDRYWPLVEMSVWDKLDDYSRGTPALLYGGISL